MIGLSLAYLYGLFALTQRGLSLGQQRARRDDLVHGLQRLRAPRVATLPHPQCGAREHEAGLGVVVVARARRPMSEPFDAVTGGATMQQRRRGRGASLLA